MHCIRKAQPKTRYPVEGLFGCQESTFPERQLELHLLSLLQTKICEQCAVTNQVIASNQLLGGSENKQTKNHC